jgi:hypothetical protein
MELLEERKEHPCTPEEQAGPEALECPVCHRKTLHQYTREPMCGCPRAEKGVPTMPAAPIGECRCPPQTCHPEDNEGCRCWRSGCYIPKGYFSRHQDSIPERQP